MERAGIVGCWVLQVCLSPGDARSNIVLVLFVRPESAFGPSHTESGRQVPSDIEYSAFPKLVFIKNR